MSKYIPKEFAPRIYSAWLRIFQTMTERERSEALLAIAAYPSYEPEDVPLWPFLKGEIDRQYETFKGFSQQQSDKRKGRTMDNHGQPRSTMDNHGHPPSSNNKKKEDGIRNKNTYIPASESASASSSASEEPRRAEKKTSVIQKPEGVELDDWSAFLKLRKEKKMPLTKRALDLMHAEGKKANLSMQQVIVKCLEESWAGFKASWLENKPVEKHEESSIHKVRNPGPPPSKDDDGWKAQEAYFKSLNMFKGAS